MKSENSAQQILSVISFSATGAALARHLRERMQGRPVRLYGKYSGEAAPEPACDALKDTTKTERDKLESVPEADSEESFAETPVTCSIALWAGERMREKDALLFIGASGIAVRSIAPHIKNKLVDSPVLVMDELGKHIIPLLSGHVGGANAIALEIADAIGADPVITTATDLHERFAVDVFAKKNHLRIVNKNGIAPVSSKVLRGEELTLAAQDGCISEEALRELPNGVRCIPFDNGESADILIAAEDRPGRRTIFLTPKPYVIGIGCRKDKEPEAVEAFLTQVLAENGITEAEIYAAASVDIKKDEPGILAFCRKLRIPYFTFSAEELLAVPGDFEESEFVKKTVGVGNVCERAAACAAMRIAAEVRRKDAGEAGQPETSKSGLADAEKAGQPGAEETSENGSGLPEFVLRKTRGDGVTCSIAVWRSVKKD